MKKPIPGDTQRARSHTMVSWNDAKSHIFEDFKDDNCPCSLKIGRQVFPRCDKFHVCDTECHDFKHWVQTGKREQDPDSRVNSAEIIQLKEVSG